MHESEHGTPLYRRSEAVAVNEDHRRAITVAQCSVGVVRGSSSVVGVQWVRLGAKLAGVWVFGSSSTERGWRGPSAAGSTFRACRATATVPWACVGMVGTRGEPGGVGRRRVAWRAGSGPRWPPLKVQPPQKLPTLARLVTTDARNRPSERAGCWSRGRGCVQRARAHCGRVTESDEGKTTLNF